MCKHFGNFVVWVNDTIKYFKFADNVSNFGNAILKGGFPYGQK